MKRVLIVDDDVAVTNYFMVFLMQTGTFEPTVVNDSRQVEGLLGEESFDVMMLDLDMPNVSGMDILALMAERGISMPVVILTGVNDVDLAVKCMKRGAFDYLTKPVDDEYLLEVLDNALQHGAMHETIDRLPDMLTREELSNVAAFEHLPTVDPAMIRLFHQAEKMADSDLCIFIWGERGTGKEELARAIHKASPRSKEPFVAVDSASHRPGEFSSELFGRARDWSGRHEEKPGFLESASGGTLFIDNVEHLDLPVQARLKRFIQNGEYYRDNSTDILSADVRIVVASTHDLTSSKYRETFNRDLLYHLMVNSIRIPPLRERREDIDVLSRHFLGQESERTGKRVKTVSDGVLELLRGYSFPDNVQELRNIIASAVVGTEGDTVIPESLSPYIRDRITPGGVPGDFTPKTLRETVTDQVCRTLEYCGGDCEQAARLLDISTERMEEIVGEEGEGCE